MYLSECEEEEATVVICKKENERGRGVNGEVERVVSGTGWLNKKVRGWGMQQRDTADRLINMMADRPVFMLGCQ